MSKHFTTYTIVRDECEIDLEIEYIYHPAVAERGPSYASGGEPAEPAFIEITKLESDQLPNIETTDLEDEDIRDWCLGEAQDELIAAEDDAADYRYQQLREDRA